MDYRLQFNAFAQPGALEIMRAIMHRSSSA